MKQEQPVSSRTPTTPGRTSISPVNSCGRPASKPKKNMTGAIMLHADSDPRDGETVEAAKKRILVAYAAHDPPPSVIIDFGNGLQGLWLLEREFVFPKLASAPKSKAYDDEVQARVASVEDRNRALAIATWRSTGDTQRRPAASIARDNQFSQREEDGAGADHTPVEHRQANRRPLSPRAIPRRRPLVKGRPGGKGEEGRRQEKLQPLGKSLPVPGPRSRFAGATYEEMRDALLEHQDPESPNGRNQGDGQRRTGVAPDFRQAPSTAGVIILARHTTQRGYSSAVSPPRRFTTRRSSLSGAAARGRKSTKPRLRARLYAFLDLCKTKTGRASL